MATSALLKPLFSCKTLPSKRRRRGRVCSPETRAKMSAANKKRWEDPEHRAKMSAAQKKRYEDPKERAKAVARTTLAIQEGRLKPNGRGTSCKFISIKNQRTLSLDSLLEQSWCQVFESDPSIIALKRAFLKRPPPPIVIPYRVRRSWHNYHPDFLVTYADGHQELIECKPERYWHYSINQAKWKAARRWCAAQSPPITFRVVGYDELEEAVTIGVA